VDGGEKRINGPVFQDSSWPIDGTKSAQSGEKKRVRFDGI